MNKVEKKIIRGIIKRKLSDQDNFSDNDSNDSMQYDTIMKTEVSNLKDVSINSNVPYFTKFQSFESKPHASINDFYYENKNDTNAYSKIREMINSEYSANPEASIHNQSDESKFHRNKVNNKIPNDNNKFGLQKNDSAANYSRNEVVMRDINIDSKKDSKSTPKQSKIAYGTSSSKYFKESEKSQDLSKEELEYIEGVVNSHE